MSTRSLTRASLLAALSACVLAASTGALVPAASAATRSAAETAIPTTTILKSSRPEAHYGDPGQITATVKAATARSGTPVGNVEFTVDGAPWTTVALNAGKAVLPLGELYPSLGVGPHTVVASYIGEGGFQSSSSAPITQTLIGRTSEASTTLTLDAKGRPTFSPNRFTLRLAEPFSCNVAIHNETPNAYQVLYGTPGNWKALKYVIPAGGTGGFGVSLEGFTGYFTVREASNYVAIRCN